MGRHRCLYNGRHIVSSGNTGLNGKPYKENQIFIEPSTVVDLAPGVDHVLALHLVDLRSPLKSSMLKTELQNKGFGNVLELTGPDSRSRTSTIINGLLFFGRFGFQFVV
jgi:hypothetical protein